MRTAALVPLALGGLLAMAGAASSGAVPTPMRLDIARTFPLQETSVSAVVADLDGNGRCDLAITGYSGDSLLLILAPLEATPERRRLLLPGEPSDVVAGDLNDDGRVDLVCPLRDKDEVAVLSNTGNATFAVVAMLACASGPVAAALADLDRDGDLDLAVTCHDAGAVMVFLNHGDGTFASGTAYAVGVGPLRVLVADATSDGAPDLVTGAREGASISCLPNLGDGTFGAPLVTQVGDWVRDMAAGDLDGDGHLDLAVSLPAGGILVWGDGTGRFAVDGAFAAPPGRSEYDVRSGAAILDVDGDARPDLVFPEEGTCPYWCARVPDVLRVYHNLGGRSFRRGLGFRSEPINRSLQVADLDSDGQMDVIATGTSSDLWPYGASVSVLRGHGPGLLGGVQEYTFWPEPDGSGTTPRPWGVQAVTLRPGGLDDLVIESGTWDVHSLQLARNRDGVGFDPPVDLGPGRLAIASDLDADGLTDLVIARGDTLVTRLGLPSGGFAPAVTAATAATFLTLGDFDGDHRLDLVWRDASSNILLAPGNGDGTFGRSRSTGLGASVAGLLVLAAGAGDLRGDGRDDLILAGVGEANPEDTVLVLHPLEDGAFTVVDRVGLQRTEPHVHPVPFGVQTADLDGDGRDDVVVRVHECNAFHVLTSDAWAGLTLRQTVYQSCESAEWSRLAIGDLTDDGIPDIVATLPTLDMPSGLQLLTGRGDGTFDVVDDWTQGDDISSVTLGRFDRDSRLDVAFSSDRGAWLAVALNMLPPDGSTPALASLVSASVVDGRASLTWSVGGSALEAIVQRCDDGVTWIERARVHPDGSGRVTFSEAGLAPGTRVGYRLALADGAATVVAGTTWLTVPAAATLALAGARPNPVTGDLTVTFSLARRGPGALALYDVTGRRLATSDLTALEAGAHALRLAPAGALAPGLYLIRLTTPERALTARAIVVR